MASDKREATVDNETSIEAIGEFITQALTDATPHAVLHVANPALALEAVGSIKPSLFILDYGLPGINGLELSDRLHSIEGLEMVPTLMISADSPSRKAMQQRHITYLKKPFDLNDLIKAIEELLPQQEG
jgi:DNA-binding response OmpR family regulator